VRRLALMIMPCPLMPSDAKRKQHAKEDVNAVRLMEGLHLPGKVGPEPA